MSGIYMRRLELTYRSPFSVYVTFGTVRLFRKILEQMGQLGMTENQQYMLIYLDTDYNWLNVYYAMNNHFLRGKIFTTVLVISSFYNVLTKLS